MRWARRSSPGTARRSRRSWRWRRSRAGGRRPSPRSGRPPRWPGRRRRRGRWWRPSSARSGRRAPAPAGRSRSSRRGREGLATAWTWAAPSEHNKNIPFVHTAYTEVNLGDALDSKSDILHPVHMMGAAAAHPRHFLREWRKACGLTLEQAAERVERVSEARSDAAPGARPISMTHATLSRIERGKLPYNQVLLEILGEVYRTDLASLIMRDPSEPEGLWSIWEQLQPLERAQAVAVLKALHGARAAA